MLKKEHRLAKTKDVKTVVGLGRSFFNPLFTIKYLVRPVSAARFTVVVSTKVSKKSVARNRIKRILREEIRLKMDQFPLGGYAVLVKPAAAAAEPQELRKQFAHLLSLIAKKAR